MNKPILCVVIPCYFEEECLPVTYEKIRHVLDRGILEEKISEQSYICFVNDGSTDKTWEIISDFHKNKKGVKGINLSRNFGHQYALLAGLSEMKADVYVSIDADLQDDERTILEMVDHYLAGDDIVYGVRDKRDTDTFFKRVTALGFYKMMHILGTKTIYNHADYRLMSFRAVQELKRFKETSLFLRGLVPLIGLPHSCVYYDRRVRELGESKYPLIKMLKFAWMGVTSFSSTPLKFALYLGGLACTLSLFLFLYAIIAWMSSNTIEGWTSVIATIVFIGGVQMFLLGIIGEYIANIFDECKGRPRYTVESILED